MTVVTEEPLSRRDRKRERTRTAIVTAAIDLFSKSSVEAVTVEEIAQAADLGKGTIYNYFDTKEQIVVAFMIGIETKVQDSMRSMVRRRRGVEATLAEALLLQFRLKEPHHAFVRVFLAEMFGRTAELMPLMLALQEVTDPPLDALFRSFQKRGLIHESLDIGELILAFKTMQLGLTGLWAVEGPPFRQTTKTLRLQMKLLAAGLKP